MRAILEKFDALQIGNTNLAETHCCLYQYVTTEITEVSLKCIWFGPMKLA